MRNEHEKEEKRLKKEKEKRYKKMLKKCGVYKATFQSEINAGILKYVADGKDTSVLELTDSQRNDASFMLALYQRKPDLLFTYEPTEKLIENLEFMHRYTKLVYSQIDMDGRLWGDYGFKNMLTSKEQRSVLSRPAFVEKFMRTFHEENCLEFLFYDFNPVAKTPDAENSAADVVLKLSDEVLEQQVKKFGADAIVFVPESHQKHHELWAMAVEKDGFRALETMEFKHINKNKDLVLKACEKEGVDGLKRFLQLPNYQELSHSTRKQISKVSGELLPSAEKPEKYYNVLIKLYGDGEFWKAVPISENGKEEVKKKIRQTITKKRAEDLMTINEAKRIAAKTQREIEDMEKNFRDFLD